MKSYQKIENITSLYKPYKKTISSDNTNKRKGNVSPINTNQIKETKKTIKFSKSSINCTLQKNDGEITRIKRHNSNIQVVSNHKNINDRRTNENNNNKQKYLKQIVDRVEKYMENKNDMNQRINSFKKYSQLQEKNENKERNKNINSGQSAHNLNLNSFNKYNQRINITNKINKISINVNINNNETDENNIKTERSIKYTNSNNNKNVKERRSLEHKNNYSFYISGSLNRHNDNKKNENKKSQIKHNRIYSMKAGSIKDLNKIENKFVGQANKEKTTLYNSYIRNTSKYNKGDINTEDNKTRKSFDNIVSRKDNNNIIPTNKRKNNHYVYESKNITKDKKEESKIATFPQNKNSNKIFGPETKKEKAIKKIKKNKREIKKNVNSR